MQVDHLREFIDLARTGSFTRSARNLDLSQSALSKHIRALEQEVGFALFDRSTNHVELTEAGKIAFEGISSALEQLDRCLLRARLQSEEVVRAVRVGGCLQVASINTKIYEVETKARELGTPLRVSLYVPHTIDHMPDSARDDALDLLAAGAIDIAVIEGPESFPELDRFEHEVAFREPIVFFAAASTPLAAEPRVRLEELREKRFTGSLNYPQFQDRVREICAIRGFVPQFHLKMADSFSEFMRGDDPEEVFFLSASGAARVPDPPSSPLAKLKVDDPLAYSPVYFIWRKDATGAVLDFVAALRALTRPA